MANWSEIKSKIKSTVEKIQNNPITDELVKTALGFIPSPAGTMLLSIYENSKDSPQVKGDQILH